MLFAEVNKVTTKLSSVFPKGIFIENANVHFYDTNISTIRVGYFDMNTFLSTEKHLSNVFSHWKFNLTNILDPVGFVCSLIGPHDILSLSTEAEQLCSINSNK